MEWKAYKTADKKVTICEWEITKKFYAKKTGNATIVLA